MKALLIALTLATEPTQGIVTTTVPSAEMKDCQTIEVVGVRHTKAENGDYQFDILLICQKVKGDDL